MSEYLKGIVPEPGTKDAKGWVVMGGSAAAECPMLNQKGCVTEKRVPQCGVCPIANDMSLEFLEYLAGLEIQTSYQHSGKFLGEHADDFMALDHSNSNSFEVYQGSVRLRTGGKS